MNKELLVDYITFDVTAEQINESIKENNGRLIVSGVLQRANAKNHNNRVYPMKTLQREAEKYAGTQIKERRALGELDHPESSVVNLNNVSHNIAEVFWRGDDLCGKVEVLDTPSGKILKELFKAGIKLGISSRGLGSVKEINEDDGGQTVEVQPDFELICWDFVSNPSTHGAFMNPVNESVGSKAPVSKYSNVNRIITDILRGK